MGEYSKFISEKRRAVSAPKSLVTEDGKSLFGTFENEFEQMDLAKLKKPTRAPQFLNKKKLSLWEAAEIHLDNGILLAALCNMGYFGLMLNVFYDKREKRVFSWSNILPAKKTFIAPNLLNGSETRANVKHGFLKFVNNFGDGLCGVDGAFESKNGKIEYDFEFDRISKPSIVSIPFGDNRPLYSQKDFFRARGRLIFNGEEMTCGEDAVAIVDDHKGFYPRKMHYDWITTFGRSLNGKKEYFALNLTRNQSVNQDDFNENIIWLENDTSLLPPVFFRKNMPTGNFDKNSRCIWSIADRYDMVNLEFSLKDIFRMEINALVVKIEYYITFGILKGYVRNESGEKYNLDGLDCMGEDKTMLF